MFGIREKNKTINSEYKILEYKTLDISNIYYNKAKILLIKFIIFAVNILVFYKPFRVFLRTKLKTIIKNMYLFGVMKEIKKIEKTYKNYYIFSLFFPLGDLAIACSLVQQFKKENNCKVLVIVNDINRARIANLFPAIDRILVVHPFVYDYIYQNPNYKIQKGKIYEINHWKFYNAPHYNSKNFLELYANMLGLKDIKIEKPEFSANVVNNVLLYIEKAKINVEKTVIIFPHANSFSSNLIKTGFWIELISELENLGYEIIVNSKEKIWNKFKTVFLPVPEQLYFCSLCKCSIGVRAGFNDILGIMGLHNIIIIYPKVMYFKTIKRIEQLVEFKRAFLDEQNKTFDENMYRITSLNMFGDYTNNEIFNFTNLNDLKCEIIDKFKYGE